MLVRYIQVRLLILIFTLIGVISLAEMLVILNYISHSGVVNISTITDGRLLDNEKGLAGKIIFVSITFAFPLLSFTFMNNIRKYNSNISTLNIFVHIIILIIQLISAIILFTEIVNFNMHISLDIGIVIFAVNGIISVFVVVSIVLYRVTRRTFRYLRQET